VRERLVEIGRTLVRRHTASYPSSSGRDSA
jgi:hypothetical protein